MSEPGAVATGVVNRIPRMFCKQLNPLFTIIGVVTFAFSLGAVFLFNHRNDLREKPPTPFEELQIRGYDKVTSGKEGELVTISGGFDLKIGCSARRLGSDVCEGWLIGSSNENISIPIRVNFCSDSVRANCISRFENLHDTYVRDNQGKVVIFEEWKQIAPNSWTSIDHSYKLRITGRVSRVNGEGRFIDPIVRIEAETTSK